MATSFGRADTGLIKATAGAEQGQYIDENLMTGAAIGATASKIQAGFAAQQAKTQKAAKELQDSFNDRYMPPEGDLDQQLKAEFTALTMKHKQVYNDNQGGSTENRLALAESEASWNASIQEMQTVMGILGVSRNSTEAPAGWDAKSNYAADLFKAGKYERGVDASSGEAYYATKKEISNTVHALGESTWTPSLQGELDSLQKMKEEDLTPVQKERRVKLVAELEAEVDLMMSNEAKQKAYDMASKKEAEGIHDPAMWNTFLPSEIPSYGNTDELSSTQFTTYLDGIENPTEKSMKKNISASSYSRKMAEDLVNVKTYDDQMHLVFSDFSDDGIEFRADPNDSKSKMLNNSFANMFIYEAGRLPDEEGEINDMYLQANGQPIQMMHNDKIVSYSNKPGSDFQLIDPKEKRDLLEKHLRGYDAAGNHNPKANKDWLIGKYTNFMGKVKKDHFNIQQQAFFSQQDRYFNDGSTAIGHTSVFKNPAQMVNAKEKEYQKAIFSNGFPERLIEDMNSEQLIKSVGEDGSVFNALKEEFENASGDGSTKFNFRKSNKRGHFRLALTDVDSDDRTTTKDYTFNFSLTDKSELAAEYRRLKKILSNTTLGSNILLDEDKVPNNVNQWDKIYARGNEVEHMNQ